MSATTRRYRVTGMHCASCGLLVDDELEDLPGVRRSETGSSAGTVVLVVEDAGAPSDSEVVATVEVLGYRAERLG